MPRITKNVTKPDMTDALSMGVEGIYPLEFGLWRVTFWSVYETEGEAERRQTASVVMPEEAWRVLVHHLSEQFNRRRPEEPLTVTANRQESPTEH